MMFLVPIRNGEKLDNSWKKAPEKQLFHDVMHVINTVAKSTTDSNRTLWTDENFIKVFFHKFTTVPHSQATPAPEAIVWITQPSRLTKFLGTARSVTNPGMLTTTAAFPTFTSKQINMAIDWFTRGKRKRGLGNNGRRGNNASSNSTEEEKHGDMELWPNQLAQIPNGNQNQLQDTAIATAATNQLNDELNYLDDVSEFGMGNFNFDLDEMEYMANSQQQHGQNQMPNISNNGQTAATTSTAAAADNNSRRTRRNRNDRNWNRILQQGRIIGTEALEHDESIEIARNATLAGLIVVEKRPFIAEVNNVPYWCPFFQKGMKTNYFAQMMNPLGWRDRHGKNRSALDVLLVRIILAEMFTIIYKTKRSFVDVKKQMFKTNTLKKYADSHSLLSKMIPWQLWILSSKKESIALTN